MDGRLLRGIIKRASDDMKSKNHCRDHPERSKINSLIVAVFFKEKL
jgi:hypothetical protein